MHRNNRSFTISNLIMPDKPTVNRRTVLSMTALGLAGSGTVIAKQASTNNSVLTDHGEDSRVDWGSDAWPQANYDNGQTNYTTDGATPTGALSAAWTFGEDVDSSMRQYNFGYRYPIVADGIVYTLSERRQDREEGDGTYVTQVLHALDEADGTELWNADLKVAVRGTVEGDQYVGKFGFDGIAVADNVVYLSRWGRTTTFDAETGERGWTVEHGGGQLAVTDESLVVTHQIGDNNLTTPAQGYRVLTMSREDGSIRWKRDYTGGGSFADGSVNLYLAVANGSVYAAYESFNDTQYVHSLSLNDGTEEWKSGRKQLGSLIATENVLYIERSEEIAALDTESGKTRWKTDSSLRPAGQEFVFGAAGDGSAYVTVGTTDDNQGRLLALDADTGGVEWEVETKWYGGESWLDAGEVVVVNGVVHYFVRKSRPTDEETAVEYVLATRETDTGKLLDRRSVPSVPSADGTVVSDYPVVAGNTLYANYAGSEGHGKTLVALRSSDDDRNDDESGSDDDGNDGGSDDRC